MMMSMMMNSQQQQQQQQQPQQRQLVVVVEGTAALGPAWPVLLVEYVEKIVRTFCGFNVPGQIVDVYHVIVFLLGVCRGTADRGSDSSFCQELDFVLVAFYQTLYKKLRVEELQQAFSQSHCWHYGDSKYLKHSLIGWCRSIQRQRERWLWSSITVMAVRMQSGWTSSTDVFFRWLSSIPFMGGGFGDAAVAEGLAEALLMCCPGSTVTQVSQGRELQKHCVLVAASNPHRIPSPVPSPPVSKFMQSQGNDGDLQAEKQWWLADADTVAQAFPSCSVSLSVVAPRQLPLLRNIFSQAKRSGRAAEPATEPPKQFAQHLVLLSESFLEARMALRAGGSNNIASTGLTAKIEHQPVAVSASTISGQMPGAGVRPSSGIASGIGVMSGRPGSLPVQPVTVKTEAVTTGTLSSLLHSNTNNSSLPMQQLPSSGPISSQDTLQSSFPSLTTPDAAQDFKVLGNIPASQPLRSVGATSLPSNNMLVHSPSQSRHTIGSPSLPPSSPLSGLQPSGGGVPGSIIMPSVTAGSGPLSVPQGALGVNGQPGVGMNPSTGGLGVGQGLGVGAVHSGYNSSATATLGGNTMMGSTQPSSAVPIGQGPATGLGGQVGLNSSNQMVQNGLGLSGQAIMGGVGNAIGNSGTGSMMLNPGIPQTAGQVQAHGINNTGVPAPLHPTSATGNPLQQPANNSMKYTRLWEGILAGQRKGNVNPIPICKLEGYRQTSSPDTLAGDWPQTMQILRLIPQEYMNHKDYQRKAELLVFRPLTQHDFLVQLAEKKLCAVIQLPSQTLLLASTDKPGRMIGMLFPGDMVQIKPQVSSQQQAALAGTVPQPVAGSTFSQNQGQGQLQNQLPNNQLPSQIPNQQPRSQLLSGPTSLHGTGFLP